MTFVSWIPQGRAGNFFMTAMAVFAYCKKHGLNFSVPKFTNSEFHSPIYLHHLQAPEYNFDAPRVMINEQHFHYDELPFDESWRYQNILINGYLQSWRYWDDYRDEIIEAFKLPYEPKLDTVAIHARYGDYCHIEGKHIIVDREYLKKSMSYITEKTGLTKFKVFSDDLPLFQKANGDMYDFEYSTNSDIIADLLEISWCHSQINSSSTFSWVAAYFNQNPDKIIITQTDWFQPLWKDSHGIVDTKDIIPPSWIKL